MMATDRLTLARAFSATGMEQESAERVATAIFDAIHDNVATKADVAALGAATKADIAGLAAATKADIAALKADLALVEHRLMTRLGGLAVVLTGLLFAALHYWPPGHGG
jgi:hypothetical protein